MQVNPNSSLTSFLNVNRITYHAFGGLAMGLLINAGVTHHLAFNPYWHGFVSGSICAMTTIFGFMAAFDKE